MTQSDMASRVGISKAAVSQFEKGRNRPSSETIKKISEILNFDLIPLYSESRSMGRTATGDELEETVQRIARAIAENEKALREGDRAANEMVVIQLKEINARLHGGDAKHPHVLDAEAKAERDMRLMVYRVADHSPNGPGNKLSLRLGVSDEAALKLILDKKIRSIEIEGEGYRTNEYEVQQFLNREHGV